MNAIKSVCLLVLFSGVVINALGVNDIDHTVSGKVAEVENEYKEPRFMDFDNLFTSSMIGDLDVKVNKYVNHGSSVVKKVTQSQTLGGQTIVKTEITEMSGNNPVSGFRFKRDILHDLMDSVEDKAGHIKNKLAGAVADGVNLAQSGINKVKNTLYQKLRD